MAHFTPGYQATGVFAQPGEVRFPEIFSDGYRRLRVQCSLESIIIMPELPLHALPEGIGKFRLIYAFRRLMNQFR